MKSVKQTRTHDMVQIRVSYAKGESLLITCSRSGEKLTLVPDNFDTKVAVGSLVTRVMRAMRDEANPSIGTVGELMNRLEAAATESSNYRDFVAAASTRLGVPATVPPPRNAATGTGRTEASSRKAGRSQAVRIAFASGESLELTLANTSAGITADPAVFSLSDHITRFALGARAMGFESHSTAEALCAYAPGCPDLVSFAQGLRPEILKTGTTKG